MKAQAPGARQSAYYIIPSLVLIVLYWRGLNSWFMADDFAWLQLDAHTFHNLFDSLFAPKAQGTVRLFSERLYFLILSGIFGPRALPFHLCAMATHCFNLVLSSLIIQRLLGPDHPDSRLAGFLAPLLWAFSSMIAVPLSWASAYNQLLFDACILGGFWLFLRFIDTQDPRFYWAQAVIFLFGFGVLELNVLYPALLALYTLCRAPRHFRWTLPLFIPSAAFTALHFFVIPKSASPIYKLYLDSALPETLWTYLRWSLGPSRLNEYVVESLKWPGLIGSVCIGIGLLIFAAAKIRQRNWLPIFFLGWWVLLMLPLLPLKNHLTDYYVTLPSLGFCWLGAWAISEAWKMGDAWKYAAVSCTLFYAIGSLFQIDGITSWYYDRTRHLHAVVEQVNEAHRRSPDKTILLTGVSTDLYSTGFQDHPFAIYGIDKIFLAPDSIAEGAGIDSYKIGASEAAQALQHDEAIVLSISGNDVMDSTDRYKMVLGAQALAQNARLVNLADPAYSSRLGPTWYAAENGFRWMPKRATLQIGGPTAPNQRLHVFGYCPGTLLAKGPLELSARINGEELGKQPLRKSDESFDLAFPLPDGLSGKYSLEVTLEVSRTFQAPADPRQLGLIIGSVSIQ